MHLIHFVAIRRVYYQTYGKLREYILSVEAKTTKIFREKGESNETRTLIVYMTYTDKSIGNFFHWVYYIFQI